MFAAPASPNSNGLHSRPEERPCIMHDLLVSRISTRRPRRAGRWVPVDADCAFAPLVRVQSALKTSRPVTVHGAALAGLALRRDLGGQLATARKGQGFTQRGLAQRIEYARSTVSTVESGVQHAGRAFWEACDIALRTGSRFAQGYERIQAQVAAESQRALRVRTSEQPAEGLRAATVGEALQAYRTLGWPAVIHKGSAELVTGTALDALEVPRVAGMLAASWWRSTGGIADEIRGLPALPDPEHALAVIGCRDRIFFLAAAGSCPWTEPQSAVSASGTLRPPFIGWHSGGSKIPAPPSADSHGRLATWVYPPPKVIQLASPTMLLDLLAKAIALTRLEPQAVTLPGGVLAVPALNPSPGAANSR
jgi:transcriptional regulator with XRE-family HTH domain